MERDRFTKCEYGFYNLIDLVVIFDHSKKPNLTNLAIRLLVSHLLHDFCQTCCCTEIGWTYSAFYRTLGCTMKKKIFLLPAPSPCDRMDTMSPACKRRVVIDTQDNQSIEFGRSLSVILWVQVKKNEKKCRVGGYRTPIVKFSILSLSVEYSDFSSTIQASSELRNIVSRSRCQILQNSKNFDPTLAYHRESRLNKFQGENTITKWAGKA
jgi:hypothetical protein